LISNLIIAISFLVAISAAVLYLWLFGERDGKTAATLIFMAYLCTAACHYFLIFEKAVLYVKFIDLALFLTMVVLAMKSRKMWPLWFCGFHVLTLASHFSSYTGTSNTIEFIFNFSQFWSIPALGAAVVGIYLDRGNPAPELSKFYRID
jgi:hypothetical protein